MPGGADSGGAASDVNEETEGRSSDGIRSPDQQETPAKLNTPRPGPSNADPDELKTSSASKATSPVTPRDNGLKKHSENEGVDTLADIPQGTKIEEIGPFAMRLQYEETKSQFERLGEVMKEQAIMTMMGCLARQQQQHKTSQLQCLGTVSPPRPSILSSVISRKSLVLPSEASLNCPSSASCKGPSGKLAKLLELEKQVNNLEKQCRVMDRHLREQDRDQKSMHTKLHRLEMKILHDGQKQMIWDMMEKIPTEEDLKKIGSFHSFALERKRTESQIKGLNIRAKALNTAMVKMSSDPRQLEKQMSLDDFKKGSLTPPSTDLPDFTSMTLEEREEFFRKCGVTLYQYDNDTPVADDRHQQKQNWLRKFKSKKVSIGEDATSAAEPVHRSTRRRSRRESDATSKSKAKAAKSAKSSKSDEDISLNQKRSSTESNQVEERQTSNSKTKDSELMSSEVAAEDRRALDAKENSPSESSVDSIGPASEEVPAIADHTQARQSSSDESNPDWQNGE